jgi:hypothetical protein
MATLKNTTFNDTGYIQLPIGTTAQRPASPTVGMMRYNTTTTAVEAYTSSGWVNMTTGGIPSVYQSATLYAQLNDTKIYSAGTLTANTVNLVNFTSFGTDEVSTSLTVLKSAAGCQVKIPQGDPGTSFSVTLWYRSNSGSSAGMLFSKFTAVDAGSYGNDIWDGGGGGGIYLNNGDGTANPYANSGSYNFKSTSWQHWAFTWNGSTASLYINGSLIGSAGTYKTFSGYVGQWSIGSWAGNYFGDYALNNARFYKFAVFGSALSASDILAIYNAGM